MPAQPSYFDSIGLLAICDAIDSPDGIPFYPKEPPKSLPKAHRSTTVIPVFTYTTTSSKTQPPQHTYLSHIPVTGVLSPVGSIPYEEEQRVAVNQLASAGQLPAQQPQHTIGGVRPSIPVAHNLHGKSSSRNSVEAQQHTAIMDTDISSNEQFRASMVNQLNQLNQGPGRMSPLPNISNSTLNNHAGNTSIPSALPTNHPPSGISTPGSVNTRLSNSNLMNGASSLPNLNSVAGLNKYPGNLGHSASNNHGGMSPMSSISPMNMSPAPGHAARQGPTSVPVPGTTVNTLINRPPTNARQAVGMAAGHSSVPADAGPNSMSSSHNHVGSTGHATQSHNLNGLDPLSFGIDLNVHPSQIGINAPSAISHYESTGENVTTRQYSTDITPDMSMDQTTIMSPSMSPPLRPSPTLPTSLSSMASRSSSPHTREALLADFRVESCQICGREFKGAKASTHKQQHIRRLHPTEYTPKRGGKKPTRVTGFDDMSM